jgi:hypothetical protein
MEHFYIETTRSNDDSSLIRLSRDLMVSFSLPVDQKKNLSINVGKNGNQAFEGEFKTDEYSIIKRISKDKFCQDYYQLLRCYHELDISSGEFFLIKKKDMATGMVWFSGEPVRRLGLSIDFYNADRIISLTIDCCVRFGKNVRHFRKAGNIIDEDKFHLFLRVLFHYLHDYENLSFNLKPLFGQFEEVVNGGKLTFPSASDWQKDNSVAIEKLTNRILSVEKRLLEIDNDTPEERIRMRGELEGLRFALTTIKSD